MAHPYSNLPPRAFWRTGVSERSTPEPTRIYEPRFPIGDDDRITAAGSCFAQHIGAQFKKRGYTFNDLEKGPNFFPQDALHRFGYDLYSARYGNIYSIRQLLQLFQRAYGRFRPRDGVWETNGRFYDPFRPSIEPDGFASREEVEADRAFHLAMVRRLLPQTDVFVFTFGLTEGWTDLRDGAVLPTCPGTLAGTFDPERHAFVNFDYGAVHDDACEFIALAREQKPNMRFLFTVSPVPLTATASGDHVLPATVYSKSVLRAVCGALRERFDFVDYFPSYELVASHPMRAAAYAPNMRTVTSDGVANVMQVFFDAHGDEGSTSPIAEEAPAGERYHPDEDDAICDELILETFAR